MFPHSVILKLCGAVIFDIRYNDLNMALVLADYFVLFRIN